MKTAQEIIKLIWEEYEDARKCKSEIWDKAISPDADFEDVRKLHLYMGRESACEVLLGLLGEIED